VEMLLPKKIYWCRHGGGHIKTQHIFARECPKKLFHILYIPDKIGGSTHRTPYILGTLPKEKIIENNYNRKALQLVIGKP